MKKSKKILSVILALVMVFSAISAAAAAFAADDSLYTDVITEEKINAVIGDADTLLKQKVITGDVFEEIYKFIPTLKDIASFEGGTVKSDTVKYYQTLYPERFAQLSSEDGTIKADVVDENGNITEKGTFTLFFEENPITFADDEEIVKEAEKLIDLILVDNVCQTLTMAVLFAPQNAEPLFKGLDKICQAMGIEQSGSLYDFILGDTNGVRNYFGNIAKTLLPDAADGIITVLRNVSDKEDLALVYTGAYDVVNNLKAVLDAAGGFFPLPGDISGTVAKLAEDFNALPTLDNPRRFDLEKIAAEAFDLYADSDAKLVFVDDITKAADGKNLYLGRLDSLLTALGDAKDNPEAFAVVFDYLYKNVIKVPGNIAIILDLVNAELPFDPAVLSNAEKDEVFELVYSLAGQASGRIEPEEPTEPAEPTVPAEPTDPSEPSTDDPENPVTPPSNGDSAVIGIFAAMAALSGAALVITRKRK